MKKNYLIHKNRLKVNRSISKNFKKLDKLFIKIFNQINLNLSHKQDTFHVLSKNFKFNFDISDLKKFNKFKKVVVIGMGGSILGAEAIYDFLSYKIKKNFYFFDDLNYEKLKKFRKSENLRKSLFIIISKSGNTIETILNLLYFKILKKNSKNLIIISENTNNFLSHLSKIYKIKFIEHKKFLGGRYSVLSEVGLVPAYFMGLNIKKLRIDLQRYLKTKDKSFLRKSSVLLSSIMKSKKYNNIIFLNYCPELEKFLFWNQQLISESLGKKGNGLLPVISNAPKDHHSLLQLYIDGPQDKIFYIFSKKDISEEKIYLNKKFKKFQYLNNKNMHEIKNAQKNAVIKVFRKNRIPFREFSIQSFKEETLGQLFSYFILETAIVGKLNNIDPFNQPAVEQVKKFTRNILS